MGTLYTYFTGGKEDIRFAIVDESKIEFTHLVRSEFPVGSAGLLDALARLIVAWNTFFEERQKLFMIMIKEAYWSVFDDDPGRLVFQGLLCRAGAGISSCALSRHGLR